MERRHFIRAGLMAASGGVLAGCIGVPTRGGPDTEFPTYEIPEYSAWPPEEPRTNDFVLLGHTSMQWLFESDDQEADESETVEDLDALLSLPLYGYAVTSLWAGFGLLHYPWTGSLGGEDEPNGMATEALTMTEGTVIFHGEYDAQVFADEYADGFDEREVNGFSVFEGRSGEDTDQAVYAVSEDAIVAAIFPEEVDGHEEAVGNLNDALANRIEAAGRIVDTEVGEWLFETTGPADLVTGFWRVGGLEDEDLQGGLEDEESTEGEGMGIQNNPLLENVDSFISTLVLPESEGGVGGDVTAARFAALYPEGEVPTEEDFREELAPTIADEVLNITTTDDRAYVAAEVTEGMSDYTT